MYRYFINSIHLFRYCLRFNCHCNQNDIIDQTNPILSRQKVIPRKEEWLWSMRLNTGSALKSTTNLGGSYTFGLFARSGR